MQRYSSSWDFIAAGWDKWKALPFFHALTGCPMLGTGKKSGWAAWTNFPDVTETVTSLTENQTTWERGGASFPGERVKRRFIFHNTTIQLWKLWATTQSGGLPERHKAHHSWPPIVTKQEHKTSRGYYVQNIEQLADAHVQELIQCIVGHGNRR